MGGVIEGERIDRRARNVGLFVYLVTNLFKESEINVFFVFPFPELNFDWNHWRTPLF